MDRRAGRFGGGARFLCVMAQVLRVGVQAAELRFMRITIFMI
jgi:hypothetical protein